MQFDNKKTCVSFYFQRFGLHLVNSAMDYTLEFDWIYGKDYHNESITNDTMKREEN